jgi:pyruvate,water dikinase
MIINANYGLGESIVSGAVDPDEYRVATRTALLLEKKIGRKQARTVAKKDGGTELVPSAPNSGQVLSEENIRRLALLTLRVMDQLGKGEQHQDIEWVFDGTDFILVQARPVTALPRHTYPELRSQPDIWSNANSGTFFPWLFRPHLEHYPA